MSEQQLNLQKTENPSNLKNDFSLQTNLSMLTPIAPHLFE